MSSALKLHEGTTSVNALILARKSFPTPSGTVREEIPLF